jgi:hypothetical protein
MSELTGQKLTRFIAIDWIKEGKFGDVIYLLTGEKLGSVFKSSGTQGNWLFDPNIIFFDTAMLEAVHEALEKLKELYP